MTGTREEWLNRAAELLNARIALWTDLKPSKKVLVSAGWPRNDRKGVVIGQCYAKRSSKGTHHVFISPLLGNATEVLPTLLHELIHAADDCQSHHKGAFRKAWKALGFVGKPTESTTSPDLKAALREIAGELGKYPHSRLVAVSAPVKQGIRQLKVECNDCGCIVRMTQKWLDEVGAPTCGCGGKMEKEEK